MEAICSFWKRELTNEVSNTHKKQALAHRTHLILQCEYFSLSVFLCTKLSKMTGQLPDIISIMRIKL
jgi:hypothetical protein